MQIALIQDTGLRARALRAWHRCDYSDAALVLRDGTVFAVVPGRGVRWRASLAHAFPDALYIDLFDVDGLSEAAETQAEMLASDAVNARADVWREFFPRARLRGWTGAQLVHRALLYAGTPVLMRTDGADLRPCDLARSPRLQFLTTVATLPPPIPAARRKVGAR